MGDNFDASETDSTITVRDYNGPSIKVQPNGKFTFASEFKVNVVFWVCNRCSLLYIINY